MCAQFGQKESNKFFILKQDDKKEEKKPVGKLPFGMQDLDLDDLLLDEGVDLGFGSAPKKEEHKCSVLGPWREGKAEVLDGQLKFKEFPARVEKYIGRQKEIFEVVHNIMQNRLVTIIGLPGIGKTSLAKNAVNFIADRRLFEAGIIFLALKGYMNCEIFLKKLLVNLIISNFDIDKED